MKQIVNQKIDQYKDSDPDKAKDWQNAGLVLDMLAGGLSSPGEGLGIVAGAANPAVAQMIKGMVNDGTPEEGGLSHLLAHGIAGAAMAAANGGDLLSGALMAGGAEALAPIIAEFLYGKGDHPEELTADEKNTLSAIIGILGTGAGALTGDSAIDAVIGDSVATNAVENNLFKDIFDSYYDVSEQIAEKNCHDDPSCSSLPDDQKNVVIIENTLENLEEIIEPYKELGDFLLATEELIIDFTPLLGDAKGFAEAEDAIDVAIATAGLFIPGNVVEKLLKEAKVALKAGDYKKAEELTQRAQKEAQAQKTVSQSGNKTQGSVGGSGKQEPNSVGKDKVKENIADNKQLIEGIDGDFVMDSKKLDYFFGKVTEGKPHNILRSQQNLKDLNTLGIFSEKELLPYLNQASKTGREISSKSNQYGTTVVKSVQINSGGKIWVL